LLQDRAEIHLYNLKSNGEQVYVDFEYLQSTRISEFVKKEFFLSSEEIRKLLSMHKEPYLALENGHANAV
jgi:UDPglucose 6-dehydrogenase